MGERERAGVARWHIEIWLSVLCPTKPFFRCIDQSVQVNASFTVFQNVPPRSPSGSRLISYTRCLSCISRFIFKSVFQRRQQVNLICLLRYRRVASRFLDCRKLKLATKLGSRINDWATLVISSTLFWDRSNQPIYSTTDHKSFVRSMCRV